MYYILGIDFGDYYSTFMEAFEVQQKKYKNKKIIHKDNEILEIVWKPEWSKINCKELLNHG